MQLEPEQSDIPSPLCLRRQLPLLKHVPTQAPLKESQLFFLSAFCAPRLPATSPDRDPPSLSPLPSVPVSVTFCLPMMMIRREFLCFCPGVCAHTRACVCLQWTGDSSCQASQICRCLCVFAHERLALSLAASSWNGTSKKNSEGRT